MTYRTYNQVEAELFETSKEAILLERMRNDGTLGVDGSKTLYEANQRMTQLKAELESIKKYGSVWREQDIPVPYDFMRLTGDYVPDLSKNVEVPAEMIDQVNEAFNATKNIDPLQRAIMELTVELREAKQGLGMKLAKTAVRTATKLSRDLWNAIPEPSKSDSPLAKNARRAERDAKRFMHDDDTDADAEGQNTLHGTDNSGDQVSDFEYPPQQPDGEHDVTSIEQRLSKGAGTVGEILTNVQKELERIAGKMDVNKWALVEFIKNLSIAIGTVGSAAPFDIELRNIGKDFGGLE